MNDKLYKSGRWEKLRQRILRRDKYICQYFKRFGRAVPATMVHHIFPVEEYPEYAFEPWNLIALSNEAHEKMHDKKTNKLTAAGLELQRRTAFKYGIDIDKLQQGSSKQPAPSNAGKY